MRNKSPFIIFSSVRTDREYVSLLMSNHLRPVNETKLVERPMTLHENYFSNHSILSVTHRALAKPGDQNLYSTLQLLLQEGFDTNSLYGLSLPSGLFDEAQIKLCFPKAKIVFIYNETEEENDLNKNAIQHFIAENEVDCYVLNAKFLIGNPLWVLQQLASFFDMTVIDEIKILPQTSLTLKQLKAGRITMANREAHWLKVYDTLLTGSNWFAGNQLLVIFSNVIDSKTATLLTKINLLSNCFLEPLKMICICENTQGTQKINNIVREHFWFADFIQCIPGEDNLARQLNSIISERHAQFIYLDDLNMDFDLAALVAQGQNADRNLLSFSKVSVETANREVTLSDVLVNYQPEHNLFFSKQSWSEMPGFDEALRDNYFLWDYAIRCLDRYDSKAKVYMASYAIKEERLSNKNESDDGYKQVLIKHRSLVEACLEEFIRLAGSDHFSSQQENKILHEKIASLNVVALHARDELKSLQQIMSQLQQRIHYLENNWYQKLSSKFNRIRKIFFKKKAPGTGNLKRILLFIRFAFSKAGFGIIRKVMANIARRIYLKIEKRPVEIVYLDTKGSKDIFTYNDWIQKKLDPEELQELYKEDEKEMTSKPLISIIMPVYNTPVKYLKEAIESVIGQLYTNWELCIADDCSTQKKVQKLLHVYSVKDKRIRVHFRKENGHISATSNDALSLASGDYVVLMDHDDLITRNCLSEVVKRINEQPDVDIIYSDEDKMDESHHHRDPHFKPEWSPDHLLSRNYMGHVCVLRSSLIREIGGFTIGFEGSQDYDLMLRATEKTNRIAHIPKVLYHWRIHHASAAQGEDVKPYAYVAARKALEEALHRRGLKGDVKYLSGLRGYKIDYALQQDEMISIIIPTKDQTALLQNTIDSIISLTQYKKYEIIVLNNNSSSKEFYEWAEKYQNKYPEFIQVIDAHFPFNFSKLMNQGAAIAKGQHLLLLNNDVEIIHEDWLEIMLSYSQQKRIGAIGVKLLYPDDTIQHAGVIVGLGGIAGHTFVGVYKDEPGYFNYIQSVNNYSAVTAACLMCRKEVFEAVGGMDETFEVEYNDVDFCLKIMEAGYHNVYLPQVSLYHYESATRGHPHQSKASYERHLKEMKLFKQKWQHIIDHDPHYNPNLNLGTHDFSINFSA